MKKNISILILLLLITVICCRAQPTFPNNKDATHTYQFQVVNNTEPFSDSFYWKRTIFVSGYQTNRLQNFLVLTGPFADTVWIDYILYKNPAFRYDIKAEPVLARSVMWLVRAQYADGVKYFDHTNTFYDVLVGEDYEGNWHDLGNLFGMILR